MILAGIAVLILMALACVLTLLAGYQHAHRERLRIVRRYGKRR